MKIAVPTHRRSGVINDLTLNVLSCVDKRKIYLFISDKEDLSKYEALCLGYNLVLCNTNDATSKFNFIQNYFKDGEYIFVIEDDIKKIQSLVTNDVNKLFSFIENYCKSKKINSFGVYPSSNKFFMSKSIDIGMTYIVANFFGFKSLDDKRLLCRLSSKTDYERSLLFFKVFGSIARFNFISCVTNNYTNKGGMQEGVNRREIERESALMLCKMYPKIFTVNKKRKSKYLELNMKKDIKKTFL